MVANGGAGIPQRSAKVAFARKPFSTGVRARVAASAGGRGIAPSELEDWLVANGGAINGVTLGGKSLHGWGLVATCALVI